MTTEIVSPQMFDPQSGRLYLELRREPTTIDWTVWIGDERLIDDASETPAELLADVGKALYDYLDELTVGVDELLLQLQEVTHDSSR